MAPGSLSGLPSGLWLLPPVGLLGVVYPPTVGKPGGGGGGARSSRCTLCWRAKNTSGDIPIAWSRTTTRWWGRRRRWGHRR
eukprot:6160272-Amphidinium_carterae.1